VMVSAAAAEKRQLVIKARMNRVMCPPGCNICQISININVKRLTYPVVDKVQIKNTR